MRIIPGEFTFPSTNNNSVIQARAIFLSAMAVKAPEVLHDLSANVFPLWKLLDADAREAVKADSGQPVDVEEPHSEAVVQLRRALHRWADRHGFADEEWIVISAINTMSESDGNDLVHWSLPKQSNGNPIPRDVWKFAFKDDGWDVATESEGDARRRIEKRFRRHLQWYVKKMKAVAVEAGGKPTSRKRLETARKHCEWLIRWQVQRRTKADIADEYVVGMRKRSGDGSGVQRHTGARNITTGIQAIARELGWKSLRVGEPGAPRL